MLGRPTIWITVGQGPTALAVGGGGLDIFTIIYPETARYRLKYCLKGPLNPKPTNQIPTGLLMEFEFFCIRHVGLSTNVTVGSLEPASVIASQFHSQAR